MTPTWASGFCPAFTATLPSAPTVIWSARHSSRWLTILPDATAWAAASCVSDIVTFAAPRRPFAVNRVQPLTPSSLLSPAVRSAVR